MQVSRKLIENVGELKKALNEISVYDFDVYTSMELYYKIANKLNEVIKELMRFEGLVSDEVIKQNEKLIYLLGEGLNNEVVKKINQMVADGTMDTIINHNVFNSLNNKVENYKEELSSQIKDKANNNDLEIERKRINNLAKLSEGSTTGDAELLDIRIGHDNVVYDNAGDAVRSQYKKLKDITDTIATISKVTSKNVINLYNTNAESKGCTLNVTDEIITINGVATATTDLNLNMNFLEDGIYTFKYEIIEGNLTGNLQFCHQSELGFNVNQKGTTVNIANMNRSKIRLMTGVVCDNLKIRLWAWKGESIGNWETFGTYTVTSLNDNLKVSSAELALKKTDEIHEIAKSNKINFRNFTALENLNIESMDNAFVNAHNGKIQSSTGFRIDKFYLKQGEKLVLDCIAGENIATISTWDKGYNIMFDAPCVATNREQNTYSYVATKKEEYIIVCGRTTEGEYNYYKEIDTSMNMNKHMLNYIDSLQYNNMFASYYFKGLKGIAIGDSLTYGVVDGTTGSAKNTDKNYPYWLRRMLDCTIDIDAYPGIDAKKYYNMHGMTKDYSQYDFAIIFLGTNYGLSDTLEADTSITPYADTTTGCYCKLIEKIKSDNPNCKIILCKTYTTVGDNNVNPVSPKKVTNNVISQIGDKYKTLVLDLDIDPFKATFVDGIIHQFDKTHLGVGGYLLLASEIAKKISQEIVKKISFVNDIY